jgi:hypothetical protein
MTSRRSSGLKVPYDLRPAKQIERRMIIDGLQRIAEAGCQIRQYRYVGMGSFYFVDFVLLHRYLGIHRMTSVENADDIELRVRFNRPYRNVDIVIDDIGNVISRLETTEKHLLWLDFDFSLNDKVLQDIYLATGTLLPGSLVLVTVDVEDPVDGGVKDFYEYYREEASSFFDSSWKTRDFASANLPRLNAQMLGKAMGQGAADARDGREFRPLFSFVYADGHRMLTTGGMIVGPDEKALLKICDFRGATYLRRHFRQNPYHIPSIRLTRKERAYLDSQMPLRRGWELKQFELERSHLRAYGEMYRYFPNYAELLL